MSTATRTDGNGRHHAPSPELERVLDLVKQLSPADRGRLRLWLVQAGHVVPMDRTDVGAKAVNSVKG